MDDPVLVALDDLVAAVTANLDVNRKILRRAKQLSAARGKGRGWAEIVSAEERPLIVEMLRANQERLTIAGGRFRREQALALRKEGLTLDEIAGLFGVTRPRVVTLLREAGA